MQKLKNIEPKRVFEIFEQITKIPRESGNEKQISEYVVNFAKNLGLEVYQDEVYNVIIKKEAKKGYEKYPSIILQAHMDMVCEKNSNVVHNFKEDELDIYIDGDYIKARGTSLGADNGIGIAIILAILEDRSINSPKIEAVFTVQEETTMTGVTNIDTGLLESKMLLSLDSTKEGEIVVSSAGIATLQLEIDVKYSNIEDNLIPFDLCVTGLMGGHSGEDIDKQRANANCIMGKILRELKEQLYIKVSHINGGLKANAIPREATCKIFLKKEDIAKLEKIINEFNNQLLERYEKTDSNIKIELKEIEKNTKEVFDEKTLKTIIDFLEKSPNGVQTYANNLVESSLNIGVIQTKRNKITIDITIRSSKKEKEEEIIAKLQNICESLSIALEIKNSLPGMEYDENSNLRKICEYVYYDMYKENLEIVSIHGGVEGAIFKEKITDLDAAMISPNLYDIHSPGERVSISSVKRTYEYVLNILSNIK